MYIVCTCTCRCVILCGELHNSLYSQDSSDYDNTHCNIIIPFQYCIECPLKTNGDSLCDKRKGRRKEEEKEVGGKHRDVCMCV